MNAIEIKKAQILEVKKSFASGDIYHAIEYKKEILGIVKDDNFVDLATFSVYPIAFDKRSLDPTSLYAAELEYFFPESREEKTYVLSQAEQADTWYDEIYTNKKSKIIDFNTQKRKILAKKKEKI